MREIYREGRPPKSLRFLYRSRLGKPILRLLTCRAISKIAGKYMDSRLSRHRIKKCIRKNGIDMSQYLPETYRSFNAFFTRRIRPELRPFDPDPAAFVAPCDAKLSLYEITPETTFSVKGFDYTVATLLRDDDLAAQYAGGLCFVFRLAVTDYHRYFYLDDCDKGENIFLKGRLHTVQPVALKKRRVFTENCREYTVLHTARFGDVTQVEVGAMMVGRIVNYHGAGAFCRGEEKGRFEFGGSTIVVLVGRDRVLPDAELLQNTLDGNETVVRCGERLGRAVGGG